MNPRVHLTYGNGPHGSKRLRNALAAFFSSHFKAVRPVTADQILPISGVSALTDALIWSICSDGEGILIPQPLYTGFQVDVQSRSKGLIVPVSFAEARSCQQNDLDKVFDQEANRSALETALAKCREKGIVVRAVLITKYVHFAGASSRNHEN